MRWRTGRQRVTRRAELAGAPHGGAGSLELAAESCGIEQWRGQALVAHPLTQSGKFAGRVCEPQRDGFILRQRVGHQLRQAQRMQQAACHPGRKCTAHAGQDRQTRHQRVGGRGVGVVRVRIEKQVGLAVTRQVVFHSRYAAGEHQAIRIHAARAGFQAQIGLRQGSARHQPQHATRHLHHQAHPCIEHRRADFVVVAERAEHEADFRQPAFGARRHLIRDRHAAVRGQVAVGQVHHLLVVELLVLRRDDMPVGQDVVVIVRAHGSGITEVVDLDRCGLEREDLGARVGGVTAEVDGDVHLQIAHLLGDLGGAHLAGVDEMVERGLHACAQAALVVHPERHGDRLEAGVVVVFEHPGHQVPDRMLTEVGRHIRHADPFVAVAFALPERARAAPGVVCGKDPGRLLVVGSAVGRRHEGQGLAGAFTGAHRVHDACAGGGEVLPVADVHAFVEQQAQSVVVVGVERDQPLEHRDRLLVLPELGQQDAAITQGSGMVGLQGQDLVEALQGFLVPEHAAQQRAAVEQHFDIVGLQGQRSIEAAQRRILVAAGLQHCPVQVEQGCELRVGPGAAPAQLRRQVD